MLFRSLQNQVHQHGQHGQPQVQLQVQQQVQSVPQDLTELVNSILREEEEPQGHRAQGEGQDHSPVKDQVSLDHLQPDHNC